MKQKKLIERKVIKMNHFDYKRARTRRAILLKLNTTTSPPLTKHLLDKDKELWYNKVIKEKENSDYEGSQLFSRR